jgi:hypothetical protein
MLRFLSGFVSYGVDFIKRTLYPDYFIQKFSEYMLVSNYTVKMLLLR